MSKLASPALIPGKGFSARRTSQPDFYEIVTRLPGMRRHVVSDLIHSSHIHAELQSYSALYQRVITALGELTSD